VNSRRLIPAFLGALAISACCTLLLGRKIAHRNTNTEPEVRYITAAKSIAVGEVVKAEDLGYIDWPASQPVSGTFLKADGVTGRLAVFPLEKGQLILGSYLAAPGSATGLTTRIPDGMRAIALKSDEVVGVAGFLAPGSHVDVLATYHSNQSPETITSTVLQDALVVAVGQKIEPDPDGKPATVDVVTILAKPDDAEKVVLASSQGAIHFVLRNGGDHAATSNTPAQLAQLGGVAAPGAAPVHKIGALVPKARHYVVETVLGDKQSSVIFN
jgi:pilus assembly protein CpaB